MKSTHQTLVLSVSLAALGAIAACSSSSSGGATNEDGGGQDAAGSSGTTSSSGSSSGTSTSSSGASSSGATSSSGGSSGTTSSGGSSSGGTSSGDSGADSGGSSSGGDSGASSGGDGGCTGTLLTVANYVSWCTVSVNSGTTSTAATQKVCVATGATVQLSASPASASFELGSAPWHKTAGDNGSGDPGTVTGTGTSATSKTTVVAAGATQCVYACCPFSPGGNGCSGTGFTAPCP